MNVIPCCSIENPLLEEERKRNRLSGLSFSYYLSHPFIHGVFLENRITFLHSLFYK